MNEIFKRIKPYIGFVGGIFGIFSVIFTIYWSFHTHNQFLLLQQANVIFLESSEISNSNYFYSVKPLIKNIGKATAKDIHFKVYGIYLNELLKFPSSDDNKESFYNDHIVHDLPSDATASFGWINLLANNGSCTGDRVNDLQQVALIINIQFTDSLTDEDKFNVFLYQYSIGAEKFSSLINKDYQKIADRLIVYLEEAQKKNSNKNSEVMDQKLLDFLKSKIEDDTHPTPTIRYTFSPRGV